MKERIINKYINKKKKRKILNIIPNNYEHKQIIKEIIEDGILDEYIKKLDNKKSYIGNTALVKKGYLTSEEQFVSIINNFITYIFNELVISKDFKKIIEECIKSDKNNTLLFKNYAYDNKYIKYFTRNYNLMIINNFYNNAVKLKEELKDDFNKINLNIDKINLNKDEDIKEVLEILDEICLINKNHYALLTMFIPITKENYKLTSKQWSMLINNNINNINFIKEYRKYKLKNIAQKN